MAGLLSLLAPPMAVVVVSPTGNEIRQIENNCAIAFALAHIFPNLYVTNYCIFPFGIDGDKLKEIKIPMPLIAQQFIKLFDGFRLTANCGYCFPN
jgi:hypothetical protein